MCHGKMIVAKVLYDPSVKENKLSMTHGLYNIIQHMGHGKMLVFEVSYNPWVMGER